MDCQKLGQTDQPTYQPKDAHGSFTMAGTNLDKHCSDLAEIKTTPPVIDYLINLNGANVGATAGSWPGPRT